MEPLSACPQHHLRTPSIRRGGTLQPRQVRCSTTNKYEWLQKSAQQLYGVYLVLLGHCKAWRTSGNSVKAKFAEWAFSEVRFKRILGSSPGRVTGRFTLHSLYTLTVVGDASFVALPCRSVHYIIAAATGVLIETSAAAQGIVAVAAAQVFPAAAAFKSILPFVALDCVIAHAAVEDIVAVSAHQSVIAAHAPDHVVSAEAVQALVG